MSISASTGTRAPARGQPAPARGQGYVTAVTAVAGAFMVAAGVWGLVAPGSFTEFVDFPPHEHFVHDAGAFQLGIGATLLLALAWRDGLALALAGFLVANTVHAANHLIDLDLGGHAWDAPGLAALSLVAGVALALRLRQLGYVVGEVAAATSPALAPFARQKTILLTTYRRDGTPVGTPVSIAVDGDRAFIRTWDTAWKVRRMRNHPEVEIAPSTMLGRPTGAAVRARVRLLDGAESARAARALARKHPFLHGLIVPLLHGALRQKIIHYELVPLDR